MALQTEEQMKMAEELLFDKPSSSFAKALYFGRFERERIFPFPQPSGKEEFRLEEFLVELREFLDREMDPKKIDDEALIPDSLIRGMGDIGLLGMTIPKEYGGRGFSQYAYCRAMQEVAARCGSTAVFVNAHQSIGLRAILMFGTEEQKKTYLPELALGKKLAAFALTEPEAGSDAANVQTRAEYDPVKKVYRINGEKRWITNGGIADVLTLMARTEDGKISAFIVTPEMEGFQVLEKAMEKCSIRGTQTGRLKFTDMEVPEENILGPKGKGLKLALTVLDFGRLTFGSSCTGQAKEVLRRVLPHAANRIQFGQPLGAFPLIKEKIARIAAYSYAIESACLLTAGFVDRGEEDLMLETAMLKVFSSDALWMIVNEGMQILGGKSFFADEPFGRLLRDARLNLVGEGANEVLSNFIGLVGMRDVGMGLQKVAEAAKSPLSKRKTLLDFGKQSCQRLWARPEIRLQAPQLEEEARLLGKAIKKFYWAIQKTFAYHREEVLDRQLDVERIASMAMSLFAASAVLSRLDFEAAQGTGESWEQDLAAGKLYSRLACDQVLQECEKLFHPRDKEMEALSDMLLSYGFSRTQDPA